MSHFGPIQYDKVPQSSSWSTAESLRKQAIERWGGEFTLAFADDIYYVVPTSMVDEFLAGLGAVERLPTQRTRRAE